MSSFRHILFAVGVLVLAISANGQVTNPANGHAYQFVSSSNVSWSQAKTLAESLSFQGSQGYLATITSQSESDFIGVSVPAAVSSNAWLGGYQDRTAPDYSEPANGWRWVSGETWLYTNWAGPEPNNGNGGPAEDFLHIYGTVYGNQWNDVSENGGGVINGYVVEFNSAATPEPGTLALFGASSTIVAGLLRRRSSKKRKA